MMLYLPSRASGTAGDDLVTVTLNGASYPGVIVGVVDEANVCVWYQDCDPRFMDADGNALSIERVLPVSAITRW